MLSNHTMGQKFHRLGHPGNTGDGVRMAQAAGADLWHMNALSCPLGLVVPGLKTALQINMLAPSYIYVDQERDLLMKRWTTTPAFTVLTS